MSPNHNTFDESDSAMLSSTDFSDPELISLKERLETFVHDKVIPAEKEYEKHLENRVGSKRWTMEAVPPCVERLKNGE